MKQLKRAAREWNIPAKELTLLCEQQKIPGAVSGLFQRVQFFPPLPALFSSGPAGKAGLFPSSAPAIRSF